MAGEATALVTFSERSVFEALHGPAGSRIWRPGFVACLIEKHHPVWVVTPIGFAADDVPAKHVLVSHGLHELPAIADVVVLMASLFGGSDLLRRLAEREGLLRRHGALQVVFPSVELPDWDDNEEGEGFDEVPPMVASDELLHEAVNVVATSCRVTVMAYPGSLVSAENSVSWMRGMGIDVDEFTLVPAGAGA